MSDIIKIIRRMGFSKSTYGETIAISYSDHSIASIMPLGVLLDDQLLYARVYKGSSMYKAIFDQGFHEITINICSDPILFYYAIFDKEKIMNRISYFNNFPCIRGCDAFIRARIIKKEPFNDYSIIYMEPVKVIVKHRYSRVYNRASFAIIEALVYYSKLPYVGKDLANRYLDTIKSLIDTVYRSSRKPVHRKIIMDIFYRSMKRYRELYD